MNNKRLSPLAGAMLVSFAFGASAQAPSAIKPTYEIPTGETKNEDGPRGIALGDGLAFYPSVTASYGRDDNLFLTNANKKSSNFYTLAPGLKLQARSESSVHTLDFDAKLSRFESSRADDFNDHHGGLTSEFIFSSRAALRLEMESNKGHDPRGSTDRPSSSTPDLYKNNGVNGLFAYGGNDAAGRVELEAGGYRKHYVNNRAFTFGSDRDTTNFGGRFFARVASKTSLLVEAKSDKLDYTDSLSQLDSTERRYLAGVTWEATAATSGTIKIGQMRKNFRSASIRDFSGTGWDANVQWAPQTYSRLDLYTAKSFSESTGVGDFILTKRYGADWTHDWNSRLSTIASINRANDDFTNGGRSDTTDTIGFRVNYKFFRWLTVGGEFSNADRDSNLSAFRYKKNLYSLIVGATL